MTFSECRTLPAQVQWLRERMLSCSFCGGNGNNLIVRPSAGGTDYWEMGCVDMACVQPRSCERDARDALRKWNMRDGEEHVPAEEKDAP